MSYKWHLLYTTLTLLCDPRVEANMKTFIYSYGGEDAHQSFAKSHCQSRNLSLPLVQSEDDKGELAKYLHCNG